MSMARRSSTRSGMPAAALQLVILFILSAARCSCFFSPAMMRGRSSAIARRRFESTVAREEESNAAPPEEAAESAEQQGARISVLRQGATTVGPSSRPVTIFPGDYVVHRDMGIARFIDCVVDERWPMISCLRIHFANSAEFIVDPADRDKVSRLKSADAAKPPKLTPLTEKGLAMWTARVRKVQESTKAVAQDILALYAARNEFVREPCAADNEPFQDFEERFEFMPTVDQQQCFDDVAYDMTRSRTPMDRLVCGDVGFGKTEIAMRAIFRAVQNNRQVALLAPTTVLAAQHFRTIKRRMPGIHIEFLRGGTSQSAEGRRVRGAIANGTAVVVVGTHALLSKTVVFHRLELLVVDEEQRFGVAQKERLKAMATGVDVLTLTATPIPRTLQMSLSGIRDLSTLRTAPPGRKEIETNVVKFDDDVVKEVINREMERGGQTFFVVPRIAHIERSIRKINELVPHARVSVAHGRLKDVEDRIIEFAEGNSDVLVATSVVESGLDLPNANTIIVTDPQIFGLSALYQLRGRVGRSSRLAYAYFMYPANTPMTVDALRRLQALKELSKLGSGFELANRDLEIRGAGAIIGKQQSGVADRVGPEVYMSLLQEAIEEAKGTNVESVPQCRLLIKAAEVIVERGIPDEFLDEERRELASESAMEGKSPRDITRLARDWTVQSGGPLPSSVAAFLKIRILQAFGRRLGMEQIEAVGADIIMQVPSWTLRIFEHLRSRITDTGGFVVTYDEDRNMLIIQQLGLQSPAKQLALLLGILGELYTFLEGKENFGFD